MWQKLLQVTIYALIDVFAEKIVTPLVILAKEKMAESKRKKESKQKLKDHQNAKNKQEHKDTYTKLP